MFARFRLTELNLVPLVDTFVSIVFFALTAATVGELAPVARGVTLPVSRVGDPALQQLTLGVGPTEITLGGRHVMDAADVAAPPAAAAARFVPSPELYTALRTAADSIRARQRLAAGASVPVPLAIHGDRAVRYGLLSQVLQTAHAAGFRQITLQVERAGGARSP
jgi:biopolymer transport protein ExbD